MKKLTTLLAATLATAFALNAVPARRGFFGYIQPDGTSVQVELIGDEYAHFYRDSQGTILIADGEGMLRPAAVDASGMPVPALTAAADQSAVADAFARHAERRREAKAAQRMAARKAPAKADAAKADIAQSGIGRFSGDYPRTGKVHGLVFLVEYPNKKFAVSEPHTYFSRMLNEKGFSDNNATGSARDYFLDQSNGRFDVTFDVYGPVTLSQNYSYYGANDSYGDDLNAEKMVLEAAKLLDGEINFADYDYDNNGIVDNIFLIYAGPGEATGGSANTVWPHAWTIPADDQIKLDGKTIAGYACTNEWENYLNSVCGIGTVCHEFSHVMGLPDLYSTSKTILNCTPGAWSVMDYGSYNNNGRTPCAYTAFERNAMTWLDVDVLDGAASLSLDPIDSSNHAYLIPTETPEEFFLLENRQLQGWDTYNPGHGMLVWHVDFNQSVWDSNVVNNSSRHQYVDILEANNNPNKSSAAAMAGYAFPGTTRATSLTSTTTPALKAWSGKGIDLPITDIREEGGVIYFDVAGGYIDLDTPAAPKLIANDRSELTVEWKPVDKATEYVLWVYTKADDGTQQPFTGYYGQSMGDATSAQLTGVSGDTEYFAAVQARAGASASSVSAEGSVVTPVTDISYITPRATSALRCGTSDVTFRWEPFKEAVKYLITVEVPSGSYAVNLTVDGGDAGDEVVLPEGWQWNGEAYGSRSPAYFGTAAPSFKFSSTGHELVSPMFTFPVTSLSYWLRGASPSGQSAISVEGRAATFDKWVPIRTIVLVNEAKFAKTFTDTPQGEVRQLRFVYTKVGGNAALDDIVIETANYTYGPHDIYSRHDVGALTEVVLPIADTDCYFYVEGVDAAGKVSKPSNKVRLSVGSGIDLPVIDGDADADAPVEYFNLQGVKVENPTTGLYIRRQGSKVSKVLVK
ncbi:MAG: M6 family metalloprotease domain-containing protein [Muribaculaceae bacterium]|nr:M6 family metalloprotease domain-containing protein [Muribaculaceae bacterium]